MTVLGANLWADDPPIESNGFTVKTTVVTWKPDYLKLNE